MDNKVLDLLEIRDQIDGIDKEIVELFEKRMQLSAEVAEYKISNNKAVLDPQREKEKLNTLEKYASNSFNRVGVYELFRQMMAMSRKLQYRILAEKGKAEKIPFRKVSSLPMQKAKVVFQGVEGAYSFTAMHSFFGESIENYNVETWRDAMEAIKSGDADYAVLPIENSTAGIVADIYDLLVEYHHSIVGEQIIQVDHALMGLKNATLEDIKTVYSHPQALSQCRKFLEQHSGMESGRVSEHRNGSKESKRRRRSDSGGNCQPICGTVFRTSDFKTACILQPAEFHTVYYRIQRRDLSGRSRKNQCMF